MTLSALTATGYSLWSYAMLLVLLVLFPLLAAQNARVRNVDDVSRIGIYVSSCAVLWTMFLGVVIVLGVEGSSLASLGVHWTLGANAAIGWAAALLAYSLGIAFVAQEARRVFDIPAPPILKRVMPQTARETAAFLLVVCPTAGIAEEVLFRAFAITRLTALVGDAWLAALIASIGFAFGHTYQGAIGVVSTALIGLGYAAGYLISGSLIPAIVAHFLHNALSAFLFKLDQVAPNAANLSSPALRGGSGRAKRGRRG